MEVAKSLIPKGTRFELTDPGIGLDGKSNITLAQQTSKQCSFADSR